MNLIEHLNHVIGLVERSASPAEIRGQLVAMHQEVEGYEKAAAGEVEFHKASAKMTRELKMTTEVLRARIFELETELAQFQTSLKPRIGF
jgi:hypothetical protein